MPWFRSTAAATLVCLGCACDPAHPEPAVGPGLAAGHARASVLGPTTHSAACAPPPGGTLSGRGTAIVDGVMGAGEWSRAASINFDAHLPGGGTTPARLWVMNDDTNLYVAVRFARTEIDPGGNSLGLEFDNNDDCARANGDDAVVMNPDIGLVDDFRTNDPPCAPGSPIAACASRDVDSGGHNDGAGAFANDGAFTIYEISHPLHSGDTAHDFDLHTGDSVGMYLFLRMIGASGDLGDTTFPEDAFLKLRIRTTLAGCVRANPPQEPQWTAGRYFPSFPKTTQLFVLPVHTALHDQSLSWTPDWRISDSPETMDALTLVGMQGVINRETPCVYLDWFDPVINGSAVWLPELAQHVTLEQVDAEGGAAIDFLYREFSDRFAGAVIYDPHVPDTINLATMIAGLENRVMVAPQQLGEPGVPEFADTVDLRLLVASQGWDATDAGRLKLYQWAHDQLGPRLEKRIVGVVSPGPPTSGQIPGIPQFNPLGIAARDYLVALRAPALWLSSNDPPQRALYGQFLAEASSPIVVTGGDDEVPTVSLLSEHGDWEAAMDWPNTPLSAGSLTAFGGIHVPVKRYVANLDPQRILATLGTAPVTTLFSSDGDNISFQMDRGFHGPFGFVWNDVQGHRFAWTTNAALVDLAPLVWNYYVTSADQVTFVASLSGAGYTYPELMSTTQLDAYLQRTADYHRRTGIRVVQIDTRKGPFETVGREYYEQLEGSGYLGAFAGFGGLPVLGLGMVYAGAPAPGVTPAYGVPGLPFPDAVLADLPGRRLGDFTFRIPDWPSLLNGIGQVVADPAVPGGQAVKYPASVTTCCQAFLTTGQVLVAGTYTVSFLLKVADNSSSRDVGSIYAGIQSDQSFQLLTERTFHASEFTQAGQWQTFTFSFTLADTTPGVDLRLNFFPGVTDLYASQLHVTRDGVDPLPVFAPIFIVLTAPGPKTDVPRLAEELEAAGVVVLTPDEFMAALNPEFMIGFARPRLGAGHPALHHAQQQLLAGQYLPALLTVRAALATLPP